MLKMLARTLITLLVGRTESLSPFMLRTAARGFAMFSLATAARVPIKPSPATGLVQLTPDKGISVEAGSLWSGSPLVALVLRRPG
jgi:hypothetical protein